MMVRSVGVLSLFVLMSACGSAEDDAQVCSASVAAGARIITDDQVINSGTGDVLVCPEGDAVINTGVSRVFVLAGGEVVVNSGVSELWVVSGASAHVNAGGVSVFRERVATFTSNAAIFSETICDAIEIDLAQLPSGC